MTVLPASFYARHTLDVARDLIGMVLVHDTPDGRTSGVIVETEAYIGEDDPACHAACGPTRRNGPLYGPPGLLYVYLNYGMHWLVNVVTEAEGHPAAVLIRALAPLEGVALMRTRRRTRRTRQRASAAPLADAALCRGPGNVTAALGITGQLTGRSLSESCLRVEDHGTPSMEVAWSSRIGIRVGQDRPWRAYVPGHPAVSGTAALNGKPARANARINAPRTSSRQRQSR